MRYSILLLLISFLTVTSCRKDFDTKASNGSLEFSKTTVYLDTVFTNISSSTYTLKVYNKSNDDINIPTISLAKGDNSKYRIMVDGMSGKDGKGKYFENVELLAKDSMYVFIEATAGIVDANPTDLLYTDEILFDSGSNQQKVDLVTLIQDAVFLYPERFPDGNGGYTYEELQIGSDPSNTIRGFYLDDAELTFTNEKPYVIYGYAAVPPAKTLTIQAGARVHFHDQSGIIVANTGSIQAIGGVSTTTALENEIIFEGDRLEPQYAEVPGQWGTILLTIGSTNNIFDHVTIKNSSVGLFIQGQDATTVQIRNTQIYNSSNVGILARTGRINGENIVINKAGQHALACTLGGDYTFTHCTFANYWSNGTRQSPAVLLDNTFNDGTTNPPIEDLQANIRNSIIYGPNNIEIGLNRNNGAAFTYTIENTLVKFNDTGNQFGNNPLYDNLLDNTTNLFSNNQTPNDPKFKNTAKNNLRIINGSAAIAKGNITFLIAYDADGKPRTTSPPDLGAYEHLNE